MLLVVFMIFYELNLNFVEYRVSRSTEKVIIVDTHPVTLFIIIHCILRPKQATKSIGNRTLEYELNQHDRNYNDFFSHPLNANPNFFIV